VPPLRERREDIPGLIRYFLFLTDREWRSSRYAPYVGGMSLHIVGIISSIGSESEVRSDISPWEMENEREKKRQNECIFREFLDFRGDSHML
jgi:hypothetical protein